jgi:7-carboxy-7-deazaguanine synthase
VYSDHSLHLNILEIFTSTQGEGIQAGIKTTFIRTGGCNAACSWCDEPDSIPLKRSTTERMSINEIMRAFRSQDAKVICLTGGEPTIQPVKSLVALCEALKEKEHFISIETNTKHVVPELYEFIDLWTMSPKLGSSGNQEQIKTLVSNVQKIADNADNKTQLKFVIGSIDDILEMKHYTDAFPYIRTTVNSVWNEATYEPKYTMKELQNLLIACDVDFQQRLDFRIGIQMHKLWNVR